MSITHFSKAGAGTNTKALHRFIGSIAFIGAPRIAQVVIEDADDDRRLLLHAKNNLAPPPLGLAYRIKEKIVGEAGRAVTAPYVVWDTEHVNVTADEAIKPEASDKHGDRDDAKDFLAKVLAAGPVAVVDVNKQAAALGLFERTLKRARADMKVRADKEGFNGGWQLSLAEEGQLTPKRATQNRWHPSPNVAPLGVQGRQDLSVGLLPSGDGHLADFPDLPDFLDRRPRH